jgi:hypothetical protein
MSDFSNILAIVSIGDNQKNLKKLINALKDISSKNAVSKPKIIASEICKLETILSPRDAFFARKKTIKLDNAEGKIMSKRSKPGPREM